METFIIGIVFMAGLILGGIILFLWMRSSWVAKAAYQRETQERQLAAQTLAVEKEKLIQAQLQIQALTQKEKEGEARYHELREENKNLHQTLASLRARLEAGELRHQELSTDADYKSQQVSRLQDALMELRTEKADLMAQNRSLLENERKQQAQIEQLHEKAHLEFEKIATDILKDRTQQFTEANKTNLDAILQPLTENIAGFKKAIQDTHLQDIKDRTQLETKISELIKQTNQVSEQANNLATALKGQVKKQGNWGEMILESILEQSGLVRDRQYFLQNTIRDAVGKQLRPDVLIKLPGSRTIIVDSKVSLLAYDRYVAAETKQQQELALKEHLQSMYQHIDQLHGKNYDQIEEALDFTMLFVPIEPAYLLGIHEDPALWAHAYSKRILLISPTNLIACLKLMDDLWKREMQSQHALEIVKQGERIYEKLVGFSQSMEAVGDQLGKAQSTYQKAMGQMMTGKGNLVDQAVKLKSMGLKSSRTFSKELIDGTGEMEVSEKEQQSAASESLPN
ncbi:DNA recombination protein RmuC [Arachidicoccus rhizosphaerae]|uniref:DNA recombination protein RmuC n=1 Tax=Arachidicoccus rhizosphaerae TaxID=551991 RepID=A0A1H3Y4M8_9BACT|nr:DNA recombination protein RmuC [Arachidicoccus rhizosphaerae]SEA06569.1 DNA recombination protein RmuC [Arachidicoccus rhizosphaerae]